MAGDPNKKRSPRRAGASKRRNSKGKNTNNFSKKKGWEAAEKSSVASQKAQGGPKNQKRHVQEVERKLGHQGLVQTSSKEMQRWH